MMKDSFGSWFGGGWFYYRGDFVCAVPIEAGSHGMIIFGCSGVISITAMDHWLFNHKSEKESYSVTIK